MLLHQRAPGTDLVLTDDQEVPLARDIHQAHHRLQGYRGVDRSFDRADHNIRVRRERVRMGKPHNLRSHRSGSSMCGTVRDDREEGRGADPCAEAPEEPYGHSRRILHAALRNRHDGCHDLRRLLRYVHPVRIGYIDVELLHPVPRYRYDDNRHDIGKSVREDRIQAMARYRSGHRVHRTVPVLHAPGGCRGRKC